MAVMIRSENRKNYKVAVIVSHLFFPKTEKLIICLSSWLQLNKKGRMGILPVNIKYGMGILPVNRLEICDLI